MAFLRTAFLAAAFALAMNIPAFAEDPGTSTSPSDAAAPARDAGKDLTPEERAEKQARKAWPAPGSIIRPTSWARK